MRSEVTSLSRCRYITLRAFAISFLFKISIANSCTDFVGAFSLDETGKNQDLPIFVGLLFDYDENDKGQEIIRVDRSGEGYEATVKRKNEWKRAEVMIPAARELAEEGLPECTMGIRGVGTLMKVDKGEKIQVPFSQNGFIEKEATTGLILYVVRGSSFNFVNLKKTR